MNRKLLTVTTLIGGVAALALAASPVAGAGELRQEPDLQADVNGLVAAGAPGAILLVREGQETDRFTAGVGEIATGQPIRAGDRYRIASLTKSYTAAVVLQLVSEGKLRLHDTVERWLPGLVPNGENISIRHLLNHTSGIFNYEFDPRVNAPYLAGDLGHYWSPLELIAIAVSHPPLYPPGQTTQSTYSNTNYAILGLIVQAATGKTIQAQLRRRIFKPLRLDRTSYPVRSTTIDGRHAHGYFLIGAPPLVDVTGFSPSIAGAGGAIVSTVGEVARFYRALLGGRIIPGHLLRAMKTTVPSGFDPGAPPARYGLGLERYATSCGVAWGHSGAFPGYFTYAFSSAQGVRQAVLMVNADPGAISQAARERFYKLLDSAYCSTADDDEEEDDDD
jgi:D-alanyl-D-alanine carboxypeptidase